MNKNKVKVFLASCCFILLSCNAQNKKEAIGLVPLGSNVVNTDTITLGGGCFWCVEAIYEMMDGVESATSGYSGGTKGTANYSSVSTGTTKHVESVQIVFDATKLSVYDILEVFFSVHDPTTLNKQGADVGAQYRSVIFYKSAEQLSIAQNTINELNKSEVYDAPIVTTLESYKSFYPAEDYHQDYFENNPNYGYCRVVILPKIEKFKKVFSDKLKK